MRVEVEPLNNHTVSPHTQKQTAVAFCFTYRHQDDGVDAQSPFLSKHNPHFAPEDARSDALMTSSLPIAELFGLGERDAYQTYAD